MQTAKPRDGGGVILEGDTRLGSWRIEIDASGVAAAEWVHLNTPDEAAAWMPPGRAIDVSTSGDCYTRQLHDRLGGIPCGACDKERRRMNGLTVAECQAERSEIVEGTIERAKGSPRWWDRIRAKVGDAIAPDELRRIVGECFDRALEKAESAAKPRDP